MRFFDMVAVHGAGPMAKRLGYSRIFEIGKDFELIHSKGEMKGSNRILESDDAGVIVEGLRSPSVFGLVATRGLPKKYLEVLKKEEKVLLIPVASAVCGSEQMRAMSEVKAMARSAMQSKVKTALVTMAAEKECMLSSMQLLEVGKMAGIHEKACKQMLGLLGEP